MWGLQGSAARTNELRDSAKAGMVDAETVDQCSIQQLGAHLEQVVGTGSTNSTRSRTPMPNWRFLRLGMVPSPIPLNGSPESRREIDPA